MPIVIWIIWVLLVAIAVVGFLYVAGTYLLLYYDRRLARTGQVEPGYENIAPIPTERERWIGFLLEVVATAFTIFIYPLGWIPWRRRGGRKASSPILLVHGFNHNQSAWLFLRSRLARRGFGPVYTLNLPPRGGSIEIFSERVGERIQEIVKQTGVGEVILIGHSMGGLICAYYAEHQSFGVRQVITLGSPLGGTRIASFAHSRAAQQMQVGSPLIDDLNRRLRFHSIISYHHIASQFDNMILPVQSALIRRYPERERALIRQGHMSLLFSATVARQIMDWLSPRARETCLDKGKAWLGGN